MSKNTWYVAQRKVNGKYIALCFNLRNNQNIISVIEGIPGIITLNACDTKREAKAVQKDWNDNFQANGKLLSE